MLRALLLVVVLAGCARLENAGVDWHFGITNTWHFDETLGAPPRDTVRPPWEDPDV